MKRSPIKNFVCIIDGEKHELDEEQLGQLNKWLVKVIDKIDEKHQSQSCSVLAEQFKRRGRVYAGVSGGNLTFSVTPTGIGTVIKVTESITGEKIDLSDYDKW